MSLATEILADSPSGYWKLDEGSGSTFADSSGGGHPLTISGSVDLAYAAGICTSGSDDGNMYARFHGGAATATGPPFQCNGSFTIEAWFKLLDVGGTFPGIVAYGPDANEGAGWNLFLARDAFSHHSTGFKRNAVQGPSSAAAEVERKPACMRQWVIDWDGTTTRGYIDGVEYGSVTTGYPNVATQDLRVGMNPEGMQTADIIIAHLAIWSGTHIGAARIAVHWLAGACPGCLAAGWAVGSVRIA